MQNKTKGCAICGEEKPIEKTVSGLRRADFPKHNTEQIVWLDALKPVHQDICIECVENYPEGR